MSQDLKIALVQANIVWENPQESLENYDRLLHNQAQDADIVILPEMFNTGFSMEPKKIAEKEPGPALNWLKEMAAHRQQAFCASVAVFDEGQYYNRFYFIGPAGESYAYDKRHLFRMAGEHQQYAPGQSRLIINYKGWKICPMICYDLRFPVWSRNRQDYDCLIYVANWPKVRESAWSRLLQARAIENLSYVAAVNRVGVDGNGLTYSGRSALFDFKGDALCEIVEEQAVRCLCLNKESLDNFRAKFPAHLDADEFTIR